MELALLMLITGTLAIIALIGTLSPEATPVDGALSDLDQYILANAPSAETTPSLHRVEDSTLR